MAGDKRLKAKHKRHYQQFVEDLEDARPARAALEYTLAYRDYRRAVRSFNTVGPKDNADALKQLSSHQRHMDQAWKAFERHMARIDKQLAEKETETNSMF